MSKDMQVTVTVTYVDNPAQDNVLHDVYEYLLMTGKKRIGMEPENRELQRTGTDPRR